MPVGEICNREVVIAEKSLSVVEAARLMRTHHVGDLVVFEAREGRKHPVGIVTDRDIVVEVVAAAVNPEGLRVGDIMGPEVATVRESEGLFEALRYMRGKGVRRMPVVDAAGGLVGIPHAGRSPRPAGRGNDGTVKAGVERAAARGVGAYVTRLEPLARARMHCLLRQQKSVRKS